MISSFNRNLEDINLSLTIPIASKSQLIINSNWMLFTNLDQREIFSYYWLEITRLFCYLWRSQPLKRILPKERSLVPREALKFIALFYLSQFDGNEFKCRLSCLPQVYCLSTLRWDGGKFKFSTTTTKSAVEAMLCRRMRCFDGMPWNRWDFCHFHHESCVRWTNISIQLFPVEF